MNKEQEDLVGEAYENYLNKWDFEKYPNDGSVYNVEPIKVKEHTKPQFEYRCKTDTEFSEKWGLKIEERELSEDERWLLYIETCNKLKTPSIKGSTNKETMESYYQEYNIPTKLITIKYNDKTIESYE